MAASNTFAFGINPAGKIVGLYFDANGVSHGFLLSRKK
jgi:probable HAF family extracellular repeat protein